MSECLYKIKTVKRLEEFVILHSCCYATFFKKIYKAIYV